MLARFTYDANGRRATKTAGGITTTYVYDGPQFLEERPSAGSSKRYVFGPGIDQTLAQVVGGSTTYNLADHLGSVVRTTDSLGGPTLTRQYDPWGNLLQGSTTSGYAFTGREWDAEAGIYYYRARYYDAKIGRFISEDPARQAGGLNFYAYVSNAPAQFADPTGLAKLCWRPAKYTWGKACHCFVVLCDDTTLGAYRFGIVLDAKKDYRDDRPIPSGSTCVELTLTRTQEKETEKRFDILKFTLYPMVYGLGGTSNRMPADLLRPYGIALPSCGWLQTPFAE
jgi:RHS repeat-associated protein